jgi:hypothetical protein
MLGIPEQLYAGVVMVRIWRLFPLGCDVRVIILSPCLVFGEIGLGLERWKNMFW